MLQKHLKTVCGWREGKEDDALHVLNADTTAKLCTCTFYGTPCIRCKVLTEMSSHKKANNITILGAITCVAWPCCCSCCSCCAVRKLTGLFPAISFVPAGIVVRMIFLPNPLMLRKENWWKVSKQHSRLRLSDSQVFLQLLGDWSYLPNLLMILSSGGFFPHKTGKYTSYKFMSTFITMTENYFITRIQPSNSGPCTSLG